MTAAIFIIFLVALIFAYWFVFFHFCRDNFVGNPPTELEVALRKVGHIFTDFERALAKALLPAVEEATRAFNEFAKIFAKIMEEEDGTTSASTKSPKTIR